MSIFAAAALAAAVAAVAPTAAGATARLASFDSCTSLIDYGNRHSRRLAHGPMRYGPTPMADAMEQAASAPATGGGGARDTSTTNVQEPGVDEPDIVKTDGTRILSITGGVLRAVDTSGEAPVIAGELKLPGDGWGHQLLVSGERALVIWGDHRGRDENWRGTTMLAEVDIADSARMRILRTLEVDGDLVAARLTGTTARVVLRDTPRALSRPVHAVKVGGRTRYRFKPSTRARHWLPLAELRDRTNGTVDRHSVVGCANVSHAPTFSGLDTVTVLTIDLAKGLDPLDSDTVMTDADTVYASPTGLYVATQRWLRPGIEELPERMGTLIHKFGTADPSSTTYKGSGRVEGYLLNQFSMSELDGVLRVASTEAPDWWEPESRRRSQSFVTTLTETETGLARLGKVGGLGEGERIYAVRFIGTTGYVVTFRETDPLYTVDVADPANPRVVGELKIMGYSAYLHPAGDGLLIGVGQDADRRGATLGTQVSLFDVSDPANPVRLHHRVLADGAWSDAEYDHHAFLYWPATGLAVLPVTVWSEMGEGPDFNGAIGVAISRDAGIAEAGRLEHPRGRGEDQWMGVARAVVSGGRLYTLSDNGLMQSTLDTLTRTAWLPFH